VERVLLADIKSELMSESAYREFEREVRRLLKAVQPDPSAARAAVARAQSAIDNIMQAIRAGIISPALASELQRAESELEAAKSREKTVLNFSPAHMLPRAKDVYRSLVAKLEAIEDIEPAREAIRSAVGDIRIVPEGKALYAEMQKAGLSSSLKQIVMVAGAGFENCLPSFRRVRLR